MRKQFLAFLLLTLCIFLAVQAAPHAPLVLDVENYQDQTLPGVLAKLKYRVEVQPINLFFLIIFCLAILHSFFSHRLLRASKVRVAQEIGIERLDEKPHHPAAPKQFRYWELLYFFSEIEVVFGLWCIPVLVAMTWEYGWPATIDYLGRNTYHESLFIIVAMAAASTYPIMRFAENALKGVAKLGGGTPRAWWLSILLVGPFLGAFVKETIAMTISALLLGKHFFRYQPKTKLAYASLALLFANISIGGLLTNIGSSAIVVVKNIWNWDTYFMFITFGWKAWIAILISTFSFFYYFRADFAELDQQFMAQKIEREHEMKVPAWITAVHLLWLGWLIANNNYPIIALGSFVLFLGFYQATAAYQKFLSLREPIMVGFFLASLMILGGLQAWWISPIVEALNNEMLMVFGLLLTSITQNATLDYIATHIPSLDAERRYYFIAAVMAGGGLTFLANGPNLIGYSLLGKYFDNDIHPSKQFVAALFPTAVAALCFYILSSFTI